METCDIESIEFWRRSPEAVDHIESCRFSFPSDGKALLSVERKEGGKNRELSEKEKEEILRFLLSLNMEEDLADFRAYEYEGDYDDYSLSFFLLVVFRDKTYFAVRGCSPRREKHFREILDYFGDWIRR